MLHITKESIVQIQVSSKVEVMVLVPQRNGKRHVARFCNIYDPERWPKSTNSWPQPTESTPEQTK